MSRVHLLVAMVTALLASFNPTFACQCWPRYTPEQLYCRSDYAIEAKILSGTPILSGRYYEYEIELLNNYTPSPGFDSARHVIQADDTSSCSVQLDVGSTYLLMGDFSKDRKLEQSAQSILSTKFCDLHNKLSSNPEAAETEAGNVMSFLDEENFLCEY